MAAAAGRSSTLGQQRGQVGVAAAALHRQRALARARAASLPARGSGSPRPAGRSGPARRWPAAPRPAPPIRPCPAGCPRCRGPGPGGCPAAAAAAGRRGAASRCRPGRRAAGRRTWRRPGRPARPAGLPGPARRPAPARGRAPTGRSFSECTARSTWPASRLSRSALTKTPVPPIWASSARVTSPNVVTRPVPPGPGALGDQPGHLAGLGHGHRALAGAEPQRRPAHVSSLRLP